MKRHTLAWAVLCILTLWSTQAVAEEERGPGYFTIQYSFYGLSSSTTLFLSGFPLVFTSEAFEGVWLMQDYLKHNRQAVLKDVHVGAGETFKDLAQLRRLDIKKWSAFGAYMRRHRAVVRKMLSKPQIHIDDVRVFLTMLDSAAEHG